MEIKVIGSNSSDSITLRNRVLEAAMEVNDKITISLLDEDNINKFNITPLKCQKNKTDR